MHPVRIPASNGAVGAVGGVEDALPICGAWHLAEAKPLHKESHQSHAANNENHQLAYFFPVGPHAGSLGDAADRLERPRDEWIPYATDLQRAAGQRL